MSRAAVHKLSLYHFYTMRLIAALGAVIAVSALLYGTFLLLAVQHTAARANAQQEIKELSSSLAVMHEQYLAMSAAVTPERAVALGLVKTSESQTVFASIDAPAFTMAHTQ